MNLYTKWYQDISERNLAAAKQIKLLICDIDGVFSDGSIYVGNNGEELKTFNTKDGFGIRALLNNGVEIAIITGRTSNIVKTRMNSLGVTNIYQGMENKLIGYQQLLKDFNLKPEQVGYIGDDFPDIPVMQEVGLAVAPGDAHPYVKEIAHLTTTMNGGRGSVRELADLIVMSQQGEQAITEQLMGTSA